MCFLSNRAMRWSCYDFLRQSTEVCEDYSVVLDWARVEQRAEGEDTSADIVYRRRPRPIRFAVSTAKLCRFGKGHSISSGRCVAGEHLRSRNSCLSASVLPSDSSCTLLP